MNYQWRLLAGPCYGQYATRIWDAYLFHSVPYYTQHKDDLEYVEFNKLGTQASLGCIRLMVVDVKWIFDNCPIGTQVVIYDDAENPGPMGKPGTIYIDPDDETYRGWDPTDPDTSNPWDDKYLTGTTIRSEEAWAEWDSAHEDGSWNNTINVTDLQGYSTPTTRWKAPAADPDTNDKIPARISAKLPKSGRGFLSSGQKTAPGECCRPALHTITKGQKNGVGSLCRGGLGRGGNLLGGGAGILGDGHPLDGDGVLLGGTVAVGAVLILHRVHTGHLVHHVHALVHLAEHRVGVVQVGQSPRLGVGGNLLGGVAVGAQLGLHLLVHAVGQRGDKVKLAAAGCLHPRPRWPGTAPRHRGAGSRPPPAGWGLLL